MPVKSLVLAPDAEKREPSAFGVTVEFAADAEFESLSV